MLAKPRKHHAFADPRERGGLVSQRDGQQLRPPPSPPRPPPPHASSSSSPSSASAVNAGNGGNVDRVLFKNLVEMVPLVESLMDRRANSSFTRRASMIYTPAPSSARKISETKGRKAAQSTSTKNQGNIGDSVSGKRVSRDDESGVDDFSIFSSRVAEVENIQRGREELTVLKEQVDDLLKKLLEKDEVLKSLENSRNQMSSVYATVDELKRQLVEKDSVVKSVQSQLANAKVKLADKQAALEKLEWEAKTSNQKVEKLQGDLDTIEYGIATFMQLLEEVPKSSPIASIDENITYFDNFDHLRNIDVDELEMEEARRAYVTAIAAAKESPTDETLSAAAEARLRLQAFVL